MDWEGMTHVCSNLDGTLSRSSASFVVAMI